MQEGEGLVTGWKIQLTIVSTGVHMDVTTDAM